MPPRNRHRYQPIISDALADGEDASLAHEATPHKRALSPVHDSPIVTHRQFERARDLELGFRALNISLLNRPQFFCFAPPGKMMQGKSSLNAYAVPYIPISKKSCIDESWAANKIVGFSGKSEDVGVAAGCHFPGNVSQEHSLEELQVSDETCASEKQSMMDDSNKVEFLMWRFRGYCPESLSDFLKFNNGDLYDTVDFLEEFETDHHTKSPGTSGARHGAGPASPSSYSRGEANSS